MLYLLLDSEVDPTTTKAFVVQEEMVGFAIEIIPEMMMVMLVISIIMVLIRFSSERSYTSSSSTASSLPELLKPNKDLDISELNILRSSCSTSIEFLNKHIKQFRREHNEWEILTKNIDEIKHNYEKIVLHLNEFGYDNEISMVFLKNQNVLNTILSTLKENKDKKSETAINLQLAMIKDLESVIVEIKDSINKHKDSIINNVKDGQAEEKEIMNKIMERRKQSSLTVNPRKTK